jgi:hypothetical protein
VSVSTRHPSCSVGCSSPSAVGVLLALGVEASEGGIHSGKPPVLLQLVINGFWAVRIGGVDHAEGVAAQIGGSRMGAW